MARIAAAPFRILGRRRESLENEAAQLRERTEGIGCGKGRRGRAGDRCSLEEKASSELGAAERLKAVERGYEKALEAASREHEAQLAAERTQLQADAARAVEEALAAHNAEVVDAVSQLKKKDAAHTRSSSSSRRRTRENSSKAGKEIDEHATTSKEGRPEGAPGQGSRIRVFGGAGTFKGEGDCETGGARLGTEARR